MNKSLGVIFTLTTMFFMSLGALHAQHSDVEFGYDDPSNPSMLEIDNDFRTIENTMVFVSDFELLDPFNADDFASDNPGFATNQMEGLVLNAGDFVWIDVLNAADESIFGAGFVNYCDPATGVISAAGRIAVIDNSNSTVDLILDGDSIESGANPSFIDLANSAGDVHDHIVFDLLDDSSAPFGAYGLYCQLLSDQDADGIGDVSSEPFWIIWNHGLSSTDFDNAIKHFGVGLTQVTSDSFLSLRGNLQSGGLPETQQSDDSYLVYEPGFTLNNTEDPVWLEFQTMAPDPSSTTLVVSIEDQVSTVNLLRTIER